MFTRCHFANIIRRIYDYYTYTCIFSSSKITLSIPITIVTISPPVCSNSFWPKSSPGNQVANGAPPTNHVIQTSEIQSCLELWELTNVGLVQVWDQVKWEKCGWFMNENQRWNTEWKTCVFCNVQWGDDFKTRNLVTCFFLQFTSRMNRSTEKTLKSPPSLLLYRFIHGMFPLQTGWCNSSGLEVSWNVPNMSWWNESSQRVGPIGLLLSRSRASATRCCWATH